jgi:hypothetical protein
MSHFWRVMFHHDSIHCSLAYQEPDGSSRGGASSLNHLAIPGFVEYIAYCPIGVLDLNPMKWWWHSSSRHEMS